MTMYRILLDAEPAEGNGNNPVDAAARAYDALLARHNNDAHAVARQQFEAAERLRAEVAELRGQVPARGSRVLTADEATRFDALAALGSPDDLTTKLTAADEAISWRTARERRDLLAEACALHGLDPDVLADLPGAAELAVEIKPAVAVAGRPAKQAVVALADGTTVALDKYAEKTWPKFLPALRAGGTAPAPTTGPRRGVVATPPAPAPGGDPLTAEERRLAASGRYSRIR